MKTDSINIVSLTPVFTDLIVGTEGGAAWHQDADKWKQRLQDHNEGKRALSVAVSQDRPVGYGSLLFSSKYDFFAASNIPEINDLVVSEHWRGNGIATRLIAHFEQQALERGYTQIGLGVGLYKDYGSAQKLYNRLGYVLDGNGITAGEEAKPAIPGSMVRVDDDLIIWMVKTLA
jgi:GNAT superfamily N-acetyltransferase